MNKISQRILAVGLPLAAVATTGVAFAAWTATGGGLGAAKAGNAHNQLTATAATAPTGNFLVPGGTGDIVVHVVNNASYPVKFTTITPGGSSSYAAPANCNDGATPTPGPAVTMPSAVTVTAVTLLGGASTDVTLSGAASMALGATDACQDGSFSIPVTVS